MATSTFTLNRTNGPDVLNTTVAGNQYDPAVVATSGGAAIVFFVSGTVIAARRLDAAGEPTGAEITGGGTNVDAPEATRLANGNVLVTWQNGVVPSQIVGRIYDGNLNAVTGVMTFESNATYAYQLPDVVATADGGFVVASGFIIDGTDTDIYIRKFDSSGALLHSRFITPVSL